MGFISTKFSKLSLSCVSQNVTHLLAYVVLNNEFL